MVSAKSMIATVVLLLWLQGWPAGSGNAIEVAVREGTSIGLALSPDHSRVAIDLQGGLWIVPISGGRATRITDEYGDVRQPSWSPDGKTIAFQSYRDGTWHIWTVRPDGSGLTAVTDSPFDDREPHWSPDGTKIAFSSDRSGNYDVWLLDVATRQIRQLTSDAGEDFFPSWSPDSKQIAFVSTRSSAPGVYAIALDGAERLLEASTGAVGAPSWSPDGKVLFSVIQNMQSRLVFDGKTVATGEDYFPFRAHWVSTDEFVYPADGRIKRRSLKNGPLAPIDFTAVIHVQRAKYTKKKREFDSIRSNRALGIIRPVVAPNGKDLAFAALGDIWTTSLDQDQVPRRLTDDPFVDTDPAWSPDGTKIAFSSDRRDGMDIWIRDLQTGQDRRLTTLPTADMAPAWSPDGQRIAFVSNSGFEQGELFIVPVDGGEPRRLHRAFGLGYPSWSADGRFVVTPALRPYSSRQREGMNYYSLVPVDGGPPELIVPKEHVPIGKRAADGPALSPDGKHLAFVSNDLLYVMPVGGDGRPEGPARRLTTELADSVSWAGRDQLLYMATDRLKLVSIAGGRTRNVALDLKWNRRIPDGRLVVHAGQFIDGVHPTARADIDIIIEKNRILEIVPHQVGLHKGTVVDGTGRSVIPGLIEGHGHPLKEHGELFGRVHLAYGITTFRTLGGVPYEILEEKEAIESGRRVGPRIFTTGYFLDGARSYFPMASTVPNEALIDMELERAGRLDYDVLKTYNRLSDLLQKRAIEGAHRLGIPTSSHEIYPAALSGSDSVEHVGAGNRRGYWSKQSVMGRAYQDVIEIVANSGMSFTPTLGLDGFRTAISADPSLFADVRMRQLQPPSVIETFSTLRPPARGRPESWNTVLALNRAGARLVAGVDSPYTPYGLGLHVELQDYVAAGLTPPEALRTATINPATVMGVEADLGTLEKGKLADLVIVDGNPLLNIKDAMNVHTVIKNGEVFTLEQLLDVQPSTTLPSTRR